MDKPGRHRLHWRAKPSWYLVTTEDRMIFPAAQRTMSQRAGSTVVEVAASHSVYVSQPAPMADLIKRAVSAVAAQQCPAWERPGGSRRGAA